MISARYQEGYVLDDFKKVIETKASHWKDDGKMSAYLRPHTLFGPKFEAYLNESPRDDKAFKKEKIRSTTDFDVDLMLEKQDQMGGNYEKLL